jgi:hypothetical protein
MPFCEYEIWDGNRYRYTCHQPSGRDGEKWSPFDEVDETIRDPRIIEVCQGVRRVVTA